MVGVVHDPPRSQGDLAQALLRGSEWLEVKWQFVPVIHQWTSIESKEIEKYVNMVLLWYIISYSLL